MFRLGIRLLFLPLAVCSWNAVADNLFFATSSISPPSNSAPIPFGTTSFSVSGTPYGDTSSAFANLATGKLGLLNAGTVASSSGTIQEQVFAQLGDTITATGPSSGLAGLNLGVNITINGTTSFSDPSTNFSFLWVYAFKPGTFDQNIFSQAQNILFAQGYLLGQGTNFIAPLVFQNNNVPETAVFGDGPNTLPLSIPFGGLGTNFQIELVLGSSEFTSNPETNFSWSADFSHTIDVSLSAPDGVTLTSASGVFPGATLVPEPRYVSVLLALVGFIVLSAWRWRLTRKAVVRTSAAAADAASF